MQIQELNTEIPVFVKFEQGEERFILEGIIKKVDKFGIYVFLTTELKVNLVNGNFQNLIIEALVSKNYYCWNVEKCVENKINEEQIFYLKVTKNGKQLNRRENFRVPIDLSVTMTDLTGTKYNVKIVNLSMQGVGFTSKNVISKNGIYHFALIENEQMISMMITIVRSHSNFSNLNEYMYGARIIRSDESLGKLILNKQLEEIRKRNKT